jgi:cytochrome oxidase Cu insertion factor (SCO1/SenC/PrrC family)
MRALIFATVLSLIFGAPAMAQDRTPVDLSALGPQVGERVPDFELRDQQGQLQTLESVRGPNGSLILFHRSADW